VETRVEAATVRMTEETTTYIYGYTVALEPGEGAPDFAKHADVEEADTGWDKIERVHRTTFTTTNQELAREHGFALLGVDGEVSFSWGTVDGTEIEADDTEHDIYIDAGAEPALEELELENAEISRRRRAWEREEAAREAARETWLTEVLKRAGIDPTPWALQIVKTAERHTSGKFSRSYNHNLDLQPEVREAQRIANQLLADARNKLHARASRILNVVRVAVQS
jgi:hypothetical protein